MYYELTDHFEVAADLDRCWRFFGSAENLPLITPPWLGFTIDMKPPLPAIALDSLLDYRIRWCGLPIRWRTKIIDWTPPRQFIDLQIRGPYALWHHLHAFEPSESGGVICRDRVVYKLPIPVVGSIVHALAVRRQLVEIFKFRRRVIAEHLGWVRAIQPEPTVSPL
jgi:ligand-binding SRPBCC domain-containing protein